LRKLGVLIVKDEQETSGQYTLVDLEDERQKGHKWLFGPFLPEVSCKYTEAVEIGYVNLQEVEKTDRLHLHTKTEEYYAVWSGYMKIRVGDEVVEVSEGQILLVRPNIPHLILEVQPATRILLIKTPPGPNDKNDKIVLSQE
jgi:mannose-6-phosphate isomerase-like protein (cupin superfamily)